MTTETSKSDSLVEPQEAITYSVREREALRSIMKFLLENQPEVLKRFYDNIGKKEYDLLSYSLMRMSFLEDCVFQLIRYFLDDEFNKAVKEQILRENCPASKVSKAYLNLVGMDYLKLLMQKFVHQICVSEKKVSLEINPSICSDPEEIEENLEKIQQKVLHILKRITSQEMIDAMPPGIRVICTYVAECAQEVVPDQIDTMIGAFIFLRYINPAIFSPEINGVLPKNKAPEKIPRRNLILITKVLQNLSNNQNFSQKEQFMCPLNDLVERRQNQMKNYFNELVTFQCNISTIHSEITLEPEIYDYHLFHALLFQYREEVQSIFTSTEIAEEFNRKLDLLGSFEAKNSFTHISDIHQNFVQAVAGKDEISIVGTAVLKSNKAPLECLLIVGMKRIILLKSVSGKTVMNEHILSLKEIHSDNPSEIVLIFDNGSWSVTTQHADSILTVIRRNFEYQFAGTPVHLKIQLRVNPSDRILPISLIDKGAACGGIVNTYSSLCDFYSVPIREDLCWDLENVESRSKKLNLTRYISHAENPLSEKDFMCLSHALAYNRFFKTLIVSDLKLDKTSFNGLVTMVGINSTLQVLKLNNITLSGNNKQCFTSLFEAMQMNSGLSLMGIDFSDTIIDDRAMSSFASYLKTKIAPLRFLDLSNTVSGSVGPGFTQVLETLGGCKELELLYLNNIKLESVDEQLFINYIRTQQNLEEFRLSNTRIEKMSNIFSCFMFQTHALRVLDLSHNKMAKEEMWQPVLSWLRCDDNYCLEELNFSNTSFPGDMILEFLFSIASGNLISLNLSNNNLGVRGARLLASGLPNTTTIWDLDISDNNFTDEGLELISNALYTNGTIRKLNISRNFGLKSTNTKGREDMVEAMCQMLISKTLQLEELIMSGGDDSKSRLRETLIPFINKLIVNNKLQYLDMSRHGSLNAGAIALSKALTRNKSLKTLKFDENGTTTLGFWNLKTSLKLNKTLINLSIPSADIAKVLSSSDTDKVAFLKVIHKMNYMIQIRSVAA